MSDILLQLSHDLSEIAEAAGQYVVCVEGRPRLGASGIVWATDGLVVTAHHVLERDEQIAVGLPDGKTVPATLVGRDPATDLALLRAQTGGLTPAAWSEAMTVQVGHLVLAVGRPGQSVQVSLGVASALGGEWRTPMGGLVDHYLQTDLVMHPGFSGGPLVDMAGHVVGLNTSALLRGIGLAVPAATVRRVVEALAAHGWIRRGYLGVTTQPVRLPADLAAELGQETGLLLVSVERGSPAGDASLFLGDTIVALDDQPVRNMDDLLSLLSPDRVGQRVRVRVVRGGQVHVLTLVIGERG